MLSNCQSLVDVLKFRAHKTPLNIAFTFLNKTRLLEEKLNYAELDRKAQVVALEIQKNGLQKGDRALLIFVPGLDLIQAFFGCLYAGVIAVPVYPPLNKKLMEKTHRIIKNSNPKLVLMAQENLGKFAQPKKEKKGSSQYWYYEDHPCLVTDFLPASSFEQMLPTGISQEDIAFLQYTSGSTSYPKGVMVSHGNLLDNLSRIYQAFSFSPETIMFGWLPPYHDMGLIGNILSPIYGGFPVILMTPFSFLQNPLSWLQNIGKYQVTVSGSPNFAYDYCVKRIKEEKKQGLDLSSWEVAFNGAEPIHAKTMEHFYNAFKDYGFRKEAFCPCYGLAESTLLVASAVTGQNYQSVEIAKEHFQDHRVHFADKTTLSSHTLVSSGKKRKTVRIVDPETLNECPKDMIGEIWVQSPSVAHGYWQQPEKTAQVFHAMIHHEEDSGYFLRTGDLGFIHEDELYVTGRIKDLIILYGKNHYPQDIEYTISHSHLHTYLGSCAAFIEGMDSEYQLTLMCELKNRNLESIEQTKLFSNIFELVYQEHQLEVHKIVFIPNKTIPKTTSGKISRNFCKQHLLNNSIPIIASWKLREE